MLKYLKRFKKVEIVLACMYMLAAVVVGLDLLFSAAVAAV